MTPIPCQTNQPAARVFVIFPKKWYNVGGSRKDDCIAPLACKEEGKEQPA